MSVDTVKRFSSEQAESIASLGENKQTKKQTLNKIYIAVKVSATVYKLCHVSEFGQTKQGINFI